MIIQLTIDKLAQYKELLFNLIKQRESSPSAAKTLPSISLFSSCALSAVSEKKEKEWSREGAKGKQKEKNLSLFLQKSWVGPCLDLSK